ncbi:hypothetical protein ZWY2020_057693, partial [Hordeum vulgare]
MKNDRPPASPLGSGEHSPFKHLINTPNHVNENQVGEKLQEQKQKSGQNWFARISDEKRAESNTISYAEWALVPLCHFIGYILVYVCSYICREGFHVIPLLRGITGFMYELAQTTTSLCHTTSPLLCC